MTILNSVTVDGKNWFTSNDFCDLSDDERSRKRPEQTLQNVFRGITPGDDIGPYLSQFLLIGNPGCRQRKRKCV